MISRELNPMYLWRIIWKFCWAVYTVCHKYFIQQQSLCKFVCLCAYVCCCHKISSYRIWRKIKPIVFDAFTENKFHCWFIVDLFIWLRCVALRFVSFRFVLFVRFVFPVLLGMPLPMGMPPKKGSAASPKCSPLWSMKMFAPFNYYHHCCSYCCCYCRFNYKMHLSKCGAIGRGDSLWLPAPLPLPLPLLL